MTVQPYTYIEPDGTLRNYLYTAHSAKEEKGISKQYYAKHIVGPISQIEKKLLLYKNVIPNDVFEFLHFITINAFLYHDLGKLDDQAQQVLNKKNNDKMLNHVDAGVAYLIKLAENSDNIPNRNGYLYAAYIVHAHHIGLMDFEEVFSLINGLDLKPKKKIRDEKDLNIYNLGIGTVKNRIDSTLNNIIQKHEHDLKDHYINTPLQCPDISPNATILRMALSILVDADHFDTSTHYHPEISFITRPLRIDERIKKLKTYVNKIYKNSLRKQNNHKRINLRNKLFNICCNIKTDKDFYCFDAPVGSGKTVDTEILALRICKEQNKYGIIHIAPFQNLVSQLASVYRKTLVLPDEKVVIHDIVNEVHSSMEYSDIHYRHLSRLYYTPFTILTAVEALESLTTNRPSRSKKLNHFINKVIILDEFHLVPYHLWPLLFRNLQNLVRNFGCKIIFSSGSFVQFWNIPELFDLDERNSISTFKIYDVAMEHPKIYQQMQKEERNRCKVRYLKDAFQSAKQFSNHLFLKHNEKNQSVLIILDTIANARSVYKHLIDLVGETNVIYLTNSLTPIHRRPILKRVRNKLKHKQKTWYFVATSCIESGIDISFDVGYKELTSSFSVIQAKGRVARHAEKEGIFYVMNFTHKAEEITHNPVHFKARRVAFEEIIKNLNSKKECKFDMNPKKSTYYAQREIQSDSEISKNARFLLENERKKNFSTVKYFSRLIHDFTYDVLVDKELEKKIENGEYIHAARLSKYCFQVSISRFEKMKRLGLVKELSIPNEKDTTVDNEDLDNDREKIYSYTGLYSKKMGFAAEDKIFTKEDCK